MNEPATSREELRRRRGREAWVSHGVVAAIVLAYLWQWRTAAGLFLALDPGSATGICRLPGGSTAVFCDFANHYFPQGLAILATPKPVPGFYYPASFALLMKPFALFPYAVGLGLWVALGLLCAAALYGLAQREVFASTKGAALLYGVLFATSLPVLHNFVWGQVSILLTLLMMISAVLCQRGRYRAAAAVLAVATSIKFYPALFAIYFLVRRDFKALAVFAGTASGLIVVLPAVVLGRDGTAAYYGSLQGMLSALDRHAAASPYAGYIANAVSMFLQGSVEPRSALYGLAQACGYLLVAAGAVLLILLEKRKVEHVAYWAAALVFTMIPLAVGTCWAHYFVYLPFVQAFVFVHIARRNQPAWSRLAASAFLLPSVLLANVVFLTRLHHPDAFYRHGYLFWSSLLLLPALYLQALRLILGEKRTAAP